MTVSTSAGKRLLKRWSRRLLAVGSRGLTLGRAGRLTKGLRILTYHRIAEDSGDPFAVTRRDFNQQMELLSRSGSVVPLNAAVKALELRGGSDAQIVVTFDDGTIDFLSDATPVLLRLGLPATLFVCPSQVGAPGFLSWRHLNEISEAGISIESHGLDHTSLGNLTTTEVERQIVRSRCLLEEHLGRPVTSFAYPFGTRRDFNPAAKRTIRRAGYRSACTSINGINRSDSDLFELRRTKIEQGDNPIFKSILMGCLDGWAFIDHYLYALQNRYS